MGVFFRNQDKACRDIESRVKESDVLVSAEQRINIFQTVYKEVVDCKSNKQAHGFGYMAKLPTNSERIKFQVEEQAHAMVETQKVNSELSQQVTELQQKLEAERASMEERINLERAERVNLEERLEQERVEREK